MAGLGRNLKNNMFTGNAILLTTWFYSLLHFPFLISRQITCTIKKNCQFLFGKSSTRVACSNIKNIICASSSGIFFT